MKFYHRTTHADAILANGFRDARGQYMTDREWEGVWISTTPLDDGMSAPVLEIEIAEELVAEYEWVEEGKPYREFLVPAALLNEHGTVRLLTDDEVERAEGRQS